MATTAPVTVAGFSHVAIAVRDVDEARDFYCGLFGFEELPRPDFGPGMWLRVGDLQLHLLRADEMPTQGTGFPHFALHVPTAEFHATTDALRAAGVPFLGPPSARSDFGTEVWAAFITDPSGNVIELTDVGPLSPG
jgi:catechol 2,3-dioxygenase-like lactoylglutathione lyase family enzyme